MDPQLEQKLRKASEGATELANHATRTLTVREILSDLAKAKVLSDKGSAIIGKIAGAESFEGSTEIVVPIEMYVDPWQLQPTSTEVAPAALPAASTASLASNEGTVLKAKELGQRAQASMDALAKELDGKDGTLGKLREVITKQGAASAKLDELKGMLNIGDDVEDHELRWRISETIGLLVQYAQVESILGTVGKAQQPPGKRKVQQAVWPSNMAAASFDKERGVFKRDDLTWGRDASQQAPR